MPGILYVVATPIGNLEDMTFRAVRTLKEVALIACEDTRQTHKLTGHYGIATRLVSYHEHNERERTAEFLELLAAGQSIALVSDAGTPLISDPGFRLVEAAVAAGVTVTPVPGASAVLAALSASGLAAGAFHFAGFLPPKQTQRRHAIEVWKDSPDTIIVYEAPHRILETLADLEAVLGPGRPVVVARELTKLHEEFLRGTIETVRTDLSRRQAIKGEITLLIGPAPKASLEVPEPARIRAEVDSLIAAGLPRMDAMKRIAQQYGLGKRDVYRVMEEDG